MYEPAVSFPILTLFTFAPVLGMAVILLVPSRRADIIKTIAACASAIPMLLGFYVLLVYRDSGELQYRENLLWIDGLNVYYALGIDGISAPMVVLSGLVGFIAIVSSWGVEKQIKGYFSLILLLLTGMNGVFVALDFFLFYVFWELMLLPMYFLIGIWGGPNRVYAAIKFFLYTMAGSVLLLVVLLATWYWSDGKYLERDVAHHTWRLQEGTLAETEAARALAERNNALVAVNAAKEALIARRAAAWERMQRALPEDLAIAPEQAARTQRAIMTEYGLPWMERPERLLHEAWQIRNQLNALPPTLRGERMPMEWERRELLAPVVLERTFSFPELKERWMLFTGSFQLFRFLPALPFAALMFLFLYVAFAIKVPVFPFHTWLPWAHVEAPTAISVILAGILLKMGVYGLLRISYGLFPTMAIYFAVPIAAFGVFNIIYGACCAMAQDDMKKLVAYSSVSHMGFCMLGMAALTVWGLSGSILQMFTHGTSTSMMFLLVGVIYDRAHHRDINRFGGLAKVMPLYAGFMTIALFASMGLPGLSGFISEVLVFLGAFRSNMGDFEHTRLQWSFQSMTLIATLGVILTAAYLLWMMQRVFLGPLNEKYKNYSDINGREIFSLVPLTVLVILFGVYPQPLINLTRVSAEKLQQHVLSSDPRIDSAERKAALAGVLPALPREENTREAVVEAQSEEVLPSAGEAARPVTLAPHTLVQPGKSWVAQTAHSVSLLAEEP